MARREAKQPVADDELDALVDALLGEEPKALESAPRSLDIGGTITGPKILALDREVLADVVYRLLKRLEVYDARLDAMRPRLFASYPPRPDAAWNEVWGPRLSTSMAIAILLRRRLPLSDESLLILLGLVNSGWALNNFWIPLVGLTAAIEQRAHDAPLGSELTTALGTAVERLRANTNSANCRKAADRLSKLVSTGPTANILPGEPWADAALADLAAMPAKKQAAWNELLAACQAAGLAKLDAKRKDAVREKLAAVPHKDFRERVCHWFKLVDKPPANPAPRVANRVNRDDLLIPPHVDLLKGLAWCAGLEADAELARAILGLALSAYRKVPEKGPRHPALGNAAVAALGMMPGRDGIAQLALLKLKVKSSPAQKEIEKALTAAAKREGLPREEIDELAVPAYGMEEVGRRREELGEFVAEIVVAGSDVELKWSKADGKSIKSVPAAVKKEFAAEVKELQAAAKDISKMLTAQRERIDGLFLAQKAWAFDTWRERYLDHPLVGTIARRLIWNFENGKKRAEGIWHEGQVVDVKEKPIAGLTKDTKVALWHPIGQSVDGVMAWREWLERHEVRQPFKQAHREVYVLTDAERNTNIYSNRFAAHVLRQHQFHSLCAVRGWRNRLRMMVDDMYPPTNKELPAWGLRAEFWVEGIGDQYGRDTTPAGAYLYLSTDQVRFYEVGAPQREAHTGGGGYAPGWRQADAEPVPLERIPALVLSEILREVDLFVGVASVGNDPTWADGGPDGRHVDYWRRYSFGGLTSNGSTRKAVLERIIPRLKIAPRCTFTDAFLEVRGDVRTYKIHLGSGNILMKPNDQYLCIVPKRSAGDALSGRDVFLPFEGDGTLSIILSKAFLLADDAKITDPTIVRQIKS